MQFSTQTYRPDSTAYLADHMVRIGRVHHWTGLADCLAALGLHPAHATLVIVGGASGLDEVRYTQLQTLFERVLAPLAQSLQLNVVDGGTDTGVMRLMGRARTHIRGSFPLIGVAPQGLAYLPGEEPPQPDAAPIELHHTHCLLIPGQQWGDESPWIAAVASQLAAHSPSITVLVNGGDVTWQDACASTEAGREVVIMAGSGRAADTLADALSGQAIEHPESADLSQLLGSGLLSAMQLEEAPPKLRRALETLLTTQVNPHGEKADVLPRNP